MKKTMIVVMAMAVSAGLAVPAMALDDCCAAGGRQVTAAKTAAKTAAYTCPMHPEVSGTAPGKCPKCGMKLVQRAPAQKTGAVAAAKAYSCPMHPEVMADKTGKCPKCGMRLERR